MWHNAVSTTTCNFECEVLAKLTLSIFLNFHTLKTLPHAGHPIQKSELPRWLVRSALGNRQRAADTVEVAKGTSKSTRVTGATIQHIANCKLSYLARLVELQAIRLRRKHESLAGGWLPHELSSIGSSLARLKPDAIRLERVDAEEVVVRIGIRKSVLYLEGAKSIQILFFCRLARRPARRIQSPQRSRRLRPEFPLQLPGPPCNA